jgi:hypothetical protein
LKKSLTLISWTNSKKELFRIEMKKVKQLSMA